MGIRHKMRRHAEHLLQPGETIQVVFGAQTVSPWWILMSALVIVVARGYRVVVVTDLRILVCRSGRFRVTPVTGIDRELPRGTRIGPVSGAWCHVKTLGRPLYVAMRFHRDIDEADALIAGGASAG